MQQAVFDEGPDYIIHLGDHIRDAKALAEKFCRIPFLSVPGNCDMGSMDQPILVREIQGVRFLITHGHKHAVKMGLLRYALAAREAEVQVALFGHTHMAYYELDNGIHFLNPGSMSGGRVSYGVVEITHNNEIFCRVVDM